MYKKLTQLGIIVMGGAILYTTFFSKHVTKEEILTQVKERKYTMLGKGIEDVISENKSIRAYAKDYFLGGKENKADDLKLIFKEIEKKGNKLELPEIIYYNALEKNLIKDQLKNMILETKDQKSLAIQKGFFKYMSNLEKENTIYEQMKLLNFLLQIRENSEDRVNYMIGRLFKDIGDSLIDNIQIKNAIRIRRGYYNKIQYHIRHSCKDTVPDNLVFLAASKSIEYKKTEKEQSSFNKKLNIFFKTSINKLLKYEYIASKDLKRSYKAYMLYLNDATSSKMKSKELFTTSLSIKSKANSLYKESVKFLSKIKKKDFYLYNRELLLASYSYYNTSGKSERKEQKKKILEDLSKFIEKYPLDRTSMNIILNQAYVNHFTSILSKDICELYKTKLIELFDNEAFMSKYQHISSNKLYGVYLNKNSFISLSEYTGLVTRLDSVLKLLDWDPIIQKTVKFDELHKKYFTLIEKHNIFLMNRKEFQGMSKILKWFSRVNYRSIYPSIINTSIRENILKELYCKIYENYVLEKKVNYSEEGFLEAYSRIFLHVDRRISRGEYLILNQILYDVREKYDLLAKKEQKHFSFLYLCGQNYLYRRGDYQEIMKNYLSFRNITHSQKVLESYKRADIEYSEVEFVAKSLTNIYNAAITSDLDTKSSLRKDINLLTRSRCIKHIYDSSEDVWSYDETYLGKLESLIK